MPAVEYVHCHKGYESTTTSDNSAAAPKVKELYHRGHLQRKAQRQRPQKLRRRRRFYRLEQPVSCPNYCIPSDVASNTSDDHSTCRCVDHGRKRSTVPSIPAFRCVKICPSRSRPTHVCVPVYPEPSRLRLKSSGCRRSAMLHHPCCTQSRAMCSVVAPSRHRDVFITDELQAQYDALMQHYANRDQCNSATRIKSSAKMSHAPKECPAGRPTATPDSSKTECRRKFACPCPCPCNCQRQESSRQFIALTESLLECLGADSSPVSEKDCHQRPPETRAVEHDSLNEDRELCRESEFYNTAPKVTDSKQRNCACSKEAKEWSESRCSTLSNSEMFHYKTCEPNTALSNTKTLQNINIDTFTPKIPCATPSLTIQGMTDIKNDFSFLDQFIGTKNCGHVPPPSAHGDYSSAVFPVKEPKNLNSSLYQNVSVNNAEIDYHSKEDAKPYDKLNSVNRDNQHEEEQNDSYILHSESGTTSNQTIIDTKKLAQRLEFPPSDHSSRPSLSPGGNDSTFGRDERIASWSRSSRSPASNVTKNFDGCSKIISTNSPSHTYREFEIEDNRLHIPDSADDNGSKISSKETKKSSRNNSRHNSSRSKTSFKDSISSILYTGIDKLSETKEQAAQLIDRTVTAHLCDREKNSFVSNSVNNPQSDATGSGSRSISYTESSNRRSTPRSPVAQLSRSADLTSEGPKFRKLLKQMQMVHIDHMENDLKRLKDLARSLDIIP